MVCLLILILSTPIFIFAHLPTSSDEVIIHMTDKGFEPEEITITQETKVIFENISSRSYWPASNFHPTHRLYPDSGIEKCGTPEEKKIFDACRPVAPGEKFEFVFNYPGKWKYHDHMNPQFKGTIIVKEKNTKNYDKTTIKKRTFPLNKTNKDLNKKFSESNNLVLQNIINIINFLENFFSTLLNRYPSKSFYNQQKFLQQNIFEIIKNEGNIRYWMTRVGPKKMMEKLLADSNGGSGFDCHQEAHLIGRVAYKIYGIDLAFQQGDASCHSGFYHGALEEFVRENGTDNISQKISNLCKMFSTQFGVFECLHGLGHGIMALEDYDLPKALDDCDKLDTNYERDSCYGGVFMENIVAGQGLGVASGHYTKWLNNKDPQFPCNTDFIQNNYNRQFQCWQMQTSWMLTIFNYDFNKVISECLKAPKDMIPICFKSLGRDAAGFSLRNIQKIMTICELVPGDNNYNQCIIGALNVIIDFWGANVNEKAAELCKLITRRSAKDSCYRTLSDRLFDIFPPNDVSSRKAICNTFEKEYQSYCQ